jgi:hypothetical protein
LGRGPTKGAGGVQPEPPLGRELYDCLRSAFPASWGNCITDQEDAAFRDDFEKGMALVWDAHDARPQRLLIDMALYFADFSPPVNGSDRYTKLLQALGGTSHTGCIATLNYDCTFELAAARLGIAYRYPATLGRQIGIPVLKPHGSCNFVVRDTDSMINVTVAPAGAAYAGGDVPITPRPPGDVRPLYDRVGLSLPPVISLYAPGKTTPVSPDFVATTREAWASCVRDANVAVVMVLGECE